MPARFFRQHDGSKYVRWPSQTDSLGQSLSPRGKEFPFITWQWDPLKGFPRLAPSGPVVRFFSPLEWIAIFLDCIFAPLGGFLKHLLIQRETFLPKTQACMLHSSERSELLQSQSVKYSPIWPTPLPPKNQHSIRRVRCYYPCSIHTRNFMNYNNIYSQCDLIIYHCVR